MKHIQNIDSDFIFATVQTLGKLEYLNDKYFKRDAFDYIVIDEDHHSASPSYQKFMEYFKPKFLLGITDIQGIDLSHVKIDDITVKMQLQNQMLVSLYTEFIKKV